MPLTCGFFRCCGALRDAPEDRKAALLRSPGTVAIVTAMEDPRDTFTPLDIETGSAYDLYRLAPDPGYVRLLGLDATAYPAVPGITPDLRRVPTATVNGHFFDFPALDRHYGIPVEQTIPFSRDLRVAAFQHDPPTTRETERGPGFKSYAMDALAARYLGDAKSDLGKELAKEYGGWDHIPVDDPRYAEYLRSDLDVTRRLNAAIPWDPYERREAWVATVTARMSLAGVLIDVPCLTARTAELAARAEQGRTLLAERFGFPLTLEDGKPAKAPQRTKRGKEALESALTASGLSVASWPRGKDGSLSLAKETLAAVAEWCGEHAHPALPLIEAVQEMNGIRNNAANLLRCVTDAGRVHPQYLPFQSAGRWSVLEPGLTVLKKGVEDSELEFLLPEPGHVWISVDADQVDIRSVAAHAQDPALIALLNDPERDIHTEISAMAGVPRKAGKTLDLGWLYGRGARGMVENTPGMTRETADAVYGYMQSAFPGVPTWQRTVRDLGSSGVLLGNGWGRRLRVDPERAYTQAPAMIGQSTTRDLIAECLLDIARQAPDVVRMLRVLRHDEVTLSVPEKDAQEIGRLVRGCMSREWAPAGCSIPVRFTAGTGEIKTARTMGGLYV